MKTKPLSEKLREMISAKAHEHTHTHTHKLSLSLSLSHTHIRTQKYIPTLTRLRKHMIKRTYEHIYKPIPMPQTSLYSYVHAFQPTLMPCIRLLYIATYIYIYIYMCVCVCVCVNIPLRSQPPHEPLTAIKLLNLLSLSFSLSLSIYMYIYIHTHTHTHTYNM